MARFFSVFACLLFGAALAAEPASPLDRAVAQARNQLDAGKSAESIELLERELPRADGNKPFLELLRTAYSMELKKLEQAGIEPKRQADLRVKLALMGGIVEPANAPSPDLLAQATAMFREARNELSGDLIKLSLAAKLFAAANRDRIDLSREQQAAWAFCRIRIAADQLSKSESDPASLIAEVEESLKQIPGNAGLQKIGAEVIAAARVKQGAPAPKSVSSPEGTETVETANFLVRHKRERSQAEAVAKAAEELREKIFGRWSGPPGGPWTPKCEIALHSSAESFSNVTRQAAGSTGIAAVSLNNGQPVSRRIDLRSDDDSVLEDALPRELSHIVLADLFAEKAPPAWAELGMAVQAVSQAERDRYRRTLRRCAQSGELLPLDSLMKSAGIPNDRVTGFHVQSVSVVEFLAKSKGERVFTMFVRDSQRYGLHSALNRQYGLRDVQALEEAWKESILAVK